MAFASAFMFFKNGCLQLMCAVMRKLAAWGFLWVPLINNAHSFFFISFLWCVVTAINGLYVSLGSPSLPGWIPNGGDPCGEVWQGITCTGTSITKMYVRLFVGLSFVLLIRLFWTLIKLPFSRKMNVANLGGQLSSLGNFTSITTM